MVKFKAPEPIIGERHDTYLRRVADAFEEWANTAFEKRIADLEEIVWPLGK